MLRNALRIPRATNMAAPEGLDDRAFTPPRRISANAPLSLALFAVLLLFVFAPATPAADLDADGMPDSYEVFFQLDPTDAADALLDDDGDSVTNAAEAVLGTDPWQADTDRDGLGDATDPDPLSRAVMSWGSPLHTDGDEYVYVGPSWWVGAWKEGGDWSTNPPGWHAAGDDSLYIAIDRAQLTNNAILEVEYAGSTNAAFFIDLCDTNANAVAGIADATVDGLPGMTLRSSVSVPLAAHPEAVLLRMRRGSGDLWVYGSLLYASATEPPAAGTSVNLWATDSAASLPPGESSLAAGATNAPLDASVDPTEEAAAVAGNRARIAVKVVYVHQKRGSDALDGRAAHVKDARVGPKKSIHAGLAAADPGDTVVIEDGRYRESLNLIGKAVTVRIEGTVDLRSVPRGPGSTGVTETPTTPSPIVVVDPGKTTTTAPELDQPVDGIVAEIATTTTTTTETPMEHDAPPATVTTVSTTTTTTSTAPQQGTKE